MRKPARHLRPRRNRLDARTRRPWCLMAVGGAPANSRLGLGRRLGAGRRAPGRSTNQQDARRAEEEPPRREPEPASARTSSGDSMDEIRSSSRPNQWFWDADPSAKEYIVSEDKLEVCFHPFCSESAAAVRASEPLKVNGNYYYWELTVSDKCYGTSVMFGLCTRDQELRCKDYCNLIGLDHNGWSLSHKGLAWHAGQYRHFARPLPANQVVTVGLLLDTMRGELSYFLDGKSLGVAFTGLNKVGADLYPVVGSTAKMTRVRITGSYMGYISLLER